MRPKYDFAAVVSKNFLLYLLWALIAVVAVEWVFSALAAPKAEQTIYLFICADGVDEEGLKEKLESQKPEYVKEVVLFCYDKKSKDFSLLFATNGLRKSDILILPKSVFEGENVSTAFCPLNASYVKENVSSAPLYYLNEKAYGIKVYDGDSGEGCATDLITYCGDEKEDCYLLFNVNSKHLKNGDGTNGGAIALAAAFCQTGA